MTRALERSVTFAAVLLLAWLLLPATAGAQTAYAAAGAGGTYYCIVSRCDTGSTVGVAAGVQLTSVLGVEAGVRRHFCFDCDRFVLADASVVLQYPRTVVSPYIAAGVSLSSDPDFMGEEIGAAAAAGAWLWSGRRWGGRLELRGRRVPGSDGIAELSAAIAHRFGPVR